VAAGAPLAGMCALFRERCATTVELADWVSMYFLDVAPRAEDLAAHVTPAVMPALASLGDALAGVPWDKASITQAVKTVLAAHGLKMPQLAHAVRVLVCGRAQTPAIDAVLELFSREVVLERLRRV
jgi:glutamyl-tRNA synthetase